MKQVAVIGCGIGGLSAAIHCAKQGAQVTVFEKNSSPGGKAAQLFFNGYRFDIGPSLVTLPELLREILGPYYDSLNLVPLPNICRYFWDREKSITSSSEVHQFARALYKRFGEKPQRYMQFSNFSARLYKLAAKLFLYHAIHHSTIFLNRHFWRSLPYLPLINIHRSLYHTVKRYFRTPEVQQLFMRFATYNGSSPYKTAGIFSVINHIEHNLGAYTVSKGIYAIPVALERYAKSLGVRFRYNEEVTAINTHQRGVWQEVAGVETRSERFRYNTIISNAEVSHTATLLDEKRNSTCSYHQKILSTSALLFLWGMRRTTGRLLVHNVLFSRDYRQEWRELFDLGMVPHDPTIYINISSKTNRNDAPPDRENWFVMINVPPDWRMDWDKIITHWRWIIQKKIGNILGFDIATYIECERVLTPRHLAKMTHCYRGSLYGRSTNSLRALALRHPNYSLRYRGLYYCGGTVHPGGGIPLVLLSGKIAAELAMRNRNNAPLIQ